MAVIYILPLIDLTLTCMSNINLDKKILTVMSRSIANNRQILEMRACYDY